MFNKDMKLEEAIDIAIKIRKRLVPLDAPTKEEQYIEIDALEKLIDLARDQLYHD